MQGLSLAIRFVFTIGLKLVVFYVIVVYFWALLGKDRVILCSVHGMRNSAGLEGLSDHFLGDLCPCRLDPTEKKISAWRLVLASWNSNDPDIIHAKYFRRTLSLKGLLRHLSKGCKTGGSGHLSPSPLSGLRMSPTPEGSAHHVANSV